MLKLNPMKNLPRNVQISIKWFSIVLIFAVLSFIPYAIESVITLTVVLAITIQIKNHYYSKPRIPYYEYQAYLRSSKWKIKRLERLLHDHFTCQDCGKHLSIKTAHCHHLTYRHLKYEPIEDLISLCKDCHTKRHQP